jgi:glycerol-3-phosphate dehydrogenase (NAD(P)+)
MYKTPSPSSMHSVGVIGAGAWGTALAVAVARAGRQVTLWGRNYADLVEMASRGENRNYLPGIRLNPVPRVTGDLIDVIQNDIVLLVLPAQEIRSLAPLIALSVRPLQPLVICAKGIERGSGRLMTELLKEFIPQARLAVLSGPTFATEVARGLPTAVTIAAADPLLASQLATSFSSRSFRCYASDDLLGVELGGALKNVLAIACGVVSGKGFGDNARAALMTRGLAELRRLGQALGAKPETFMGLSGFGDLTLTCTSGQSRNYSLGLALGQGQTLDDIQADSPKLAEGLYTASAVVQRAEAAGVDVPICAAVDAILNRGADLDTTITSLLTRPLKAETA